MLIDYVLQINSPLLRKSGTFTVLLMICHFQTNKWTQFEISLQELEGRKVVMGPEDVGVAQVTLESQEKRVLQVHVVAKDPEGDLEAL